MNNITISGRHQKSDILMLFNLFMQSMIELSRTQDEEVGDGTTSVIVLGMPFFCPLCSC